VFIVGVALSEGTIGRGVFVGVALLGAAAGRGDFVQVGDRLSGEVVYGASFALKKVSSKSSSPTSRIETSESGSEKSAHHHGDMWRPPESHRSDIDVEGVLEFLSHLGYFVRARFKLDAPHCSGVMSWNNFG
jgi:hypothetical protein